MTGKTIATFAALIVVGLMGCGRSGEATGETTSAICDTSFAPCGGPIEGVWKIESTCIQGDVTAGYNWFDDLFAPPECRSHWRNMAPPKLTGTLTFANGKMNEDVQIWLSGDCVQTSDCQDATTDKASGLYAQELSPSLCDEIGQRWLGPDITSAHCRFADRACTCSIVEQWKHDEVLDYTISGSQLTFTERYSPIDYCVQGNTLTMPGTQMLPLHGVVIVNKLRKQ